MSHPDLDQLLGCLLLHAHELLHIDATDQCAYYTIRALYGGARGYHFARTWTMKGKKSAVLKEPCASQGGRAVPRGSESPLDADLTSLRGMLERGDVEGARAFVTELLARWPESRIVAHYAEVLAPPQVTIRRGERGRLRNQERAWLREHAREYPGCWLAVLENQLISANPDLAVVLAAVRQCPDTRAVLLHFQPGVPH